MLAESEYDQCLSWLRDVGAGRVQVTKQQHLPLAAAGFEPGAWADGGVPEDPRIAMCQYAYVWDQVGTRGELTGATLTSIASCSQEIEGCAHPDVAKRLQADTRFRALDGDARRLLVSIARNHVDIAGTFATERATDAAAIEEAEGSGLVRRGPWRQLVVGSADCEPRDTEAECEIVYQFDPRLVPGIQRLHEEFE